MSILIKGMEMPKDIEPALVIDFTDGIDGKRYARFYHYRYGGLTEWLEVILVQAHGRLGDLDELYSRLDGWYQTHERAFSESEAIYIRAMLAGVKETPTIIPAEEE